MNLQELLLETKQNFDFDKFKETFSQYYLYENPYPFLGLIDSISKMKVNDDSDHEIALNFYRDWFDEKDETLYPDVGVNVLSENKHYSMSLTPIQTVAGYRVDEIYKTYIQTDKLSKEEVLAHILVEITFYGFDDESIAKTTNEIKQTIDKFEQDKKEGKYFESSKVFDSLEEHLKTVSELKDESS